MNNLPEPPGRERLPAQRGGAKAFLLTMLGEFVLPAGGEVWTSTLVEAAAALDIAEKNARQATARIAESGLLSGNRHGRAVKWELTTQGRRLLETGAQRIYSFGRDDTPWDGRWLFVHSPTSGSTRAERNNLRKQLGFLGFGELEANLSVSPHTDREPEVRELLTHHGLDDVSTVVVATTASPTEDLALASRAWDLDAIDARYRDFIDDVGTPTSLEGAHAFRRVVELVHDWRRFPFSDPELPAALLPADWAGSDATTVFHECHRAWSPLAREWFRALDPAVLDK